MRTMVADYGPFDHSAMLDVGWVKKSFDTVMSDEWKNAAKEEVCVDADARPQSPACIHS